MMQILGQIVTSSLKGGIRKRINCSSLEWKL